jgi:hypothetical protein
MQPIFFITVFIVLSAMIVLESDTMKTQSQRVTAAQQQR